ncbi:adenosylcobinamide amidohydrolase [Streptomyces sp. NPDC092296]|uniref:adenosylcobinamide amidohydrolase n=1 Tax=Streptomyces sp. NPDC092296 TaxID=3366012 RepID=UPI0037F346E4
MPTPLLPTARSEPFTGLEAVERLARLEDGACRHLLVWRAGPGWRMVSSAVLGGGLGPRRWVVNAQVRPGYDRLDPQQHLADLARAAALTGPGVGLMTAAPVDACTRAVDGGVAALVTTGIGVAAWAASPAAGDPAPQPPGTINIIVAVPAPLSDAALVNALATATEAKVQALLDAGYDCSGTPSDAVCVAAREPAPGEPELPFGGPRSLWGARLARAVHAAVREGAERDAVRRASGGPEAEHPVTGPGCLVPPSAGTPAPVSGGLD